MGAAASRRGRIRRREEDAVQSHHDAAQQEAVIAGAQPDRRPEGAATDANPIQTDPPAVVPPTQPPSLDLGVTPLPEQMRKRPRRSPRFSSPLDSLAVVELQLVMQFLDTASRLVAARCSCRLRQATSAPLAWRAAPPFVVQVHSAADVMERVSSSLIRFAPIHLRCITIEALDCVTAVRCLVGFELLLSPAVAADLPRMLRHLNLAQLQLLRLDDDASKLLSVDVIRLIARLPQLHTLDLAMPRSSAGAALLQSLTGIPALTDLTVRWPWLMRAAETHVDAISGCGGLRRLSLHKLHFPYGLFAALCSSPNLRRLHHLELVSMNIARSFMGDDEPPDPDEYRAAFGALEQLHSLSLEKIYGINVLLDELCRTPPLRLLSIRCQPNPFGNDIAYALLPERDQLQLLLVVAPQLEVRLLMPASLDRWLSIGCTCGRPRLGHDFARFEEEWRDMQRAAAELDRVTIVDDHDREDSDYKVP